MGCSVISNNLTPPSFLLGFRAIRALRLKPPTWAVLARGSPPFIIIGPPWFIFDGIVDFLVGKAEALGFILFPASEDLFNNSALKAAALGFRLKKKMNKICIT